MFSDYLGKRLDHYTLQRFIGRGAMGSVYEAFDGPLRRRTAVKVLSDEVTEQPEYMARFTREAHLAARLHHPNLVTVYSAGTADGISYIAMEYVDGQTLGAIIKRNVQVPLATAVEYLFQIATGLREIHAAQIVHRDIKPSNILVDTTGRVRIADFGIAKPTDDSTLITRHPAALGTVPYLPPEQFHGEAATLASDIYSFGITAYELLTGRRPYSARTLLELSAEVQQQPPAPIKTLRQDIPDALAALVEQMIAKDPAERIGDTDEVLRALSKIRSAVAADDLSVDATTHDPPALPLSAHSRHSAVAVLVTNGVVAVLVFIAMLLAGGRSDAGVLGSVWHGVVDAPYRFLSSRPKHTDVVLLEIQQWPASAEFVGTIIEELHTFGVTAIGLDLLLDERSSLGPDAASLASPIRDANNVVLLTELTEDAVIRPLTPLAQNARALGYANVRADWDGIVRRLHAQEMTADGTLEQSFALKLAMLHNDSDGARADAKLDPSDSGRLLDFRPLSELVPIPISESSFETWPSELNARWPGFFQGKTVVVGAVNDVDVHTTPLAGLRGTIPGLVLQGLIVENLISGESIRDAPIPMSIVMVLLFLVVAILAGRSVKPYFVVLVFCVIAFAYVICSAYALRYGAVVVPVALHLALLFVAYLFAVTRRRFWWPHFLRR